MEGNKVSIYQTDRQAQECDLREHIQDCNKRILKHEHYEQLVRGDVLEIDGVQKVVDHEAIKGFFMVVHFTDGTTHDKIDLFFNRGAKRVIESFGDIGDRFICGAF